MKMIVQLKQEYIFKSCGGFLRFCLWKKAITPKESIYPKQKQIASTSLKLLSCQSFKGARKYHCNFGIAMHTKSVYETPTLKWNIKQIIWALHSVCIIIYLHTLITTSVSVGKTTIISPYIQSPAA